jgi:uncharacterized membrane protein YqaE (UPF0057 family)
MVKYQEGTLVDKFMNGGMGYGKLCIPKIIVDLILIIVFPPLYVITQQLENYFKGDSESRLTDHLDMGQIIMSLVFTSCFYFPGFIHALHVMKNKDKCGSVF